MYTAGGERDDFVCFFTVSLPSRTVQVVGFALRVPLQGPVNLCCLLSRALNSDGKETNTFGIR